MTTELTTNGDSAEFEYAGSLARTFVFYGTFDSGTVTVLVSFDGGDSWITLNKADTSAFEVTTPSLYQMSVPRCLMKFNLDGAGASADVKVHIA